MLIFSNSSVPNTHGLAIDHYSFISRCHCFFKRRGATPSRRDAKGPKVPGGDGPVATRRDHEGFRATPQQQVADVALVIPEYEERGAPKPGVPERDAPIRAGGDDGVGSPVMGLGDPSGVTGECLQALAAADGQIPEADRAIVSPRQEVVPVPSGPDAGNGSAVAGQGGGGGVEGVGGGIALIDFSVGGRGRLGLQGGFLERPELDDPILPPRDQQVQAVDVGGHYPCCCR